MADGNFESPLPKSVSSVKRGMSPEDQQDQNPPKRRKRTDADESDAEGSSNGDYISDDKRSPTPTNESHNSPEPQQPSRSAKILPSIEVSHHQGYSEGNVPPLEGMNDTIVDTIEGNANRTNSAYPEAEPTTLERHTSSTSSTQRSQALSVEDDINNSPYPHSASSPSPSPIQPQTSSPSPSLLLAELPYLSPTSVSSATASSTPPASNWVNFSPSPASGSSSYTSISEGDSDEDSEDEDWDDEMFNLWIEALEQNPGPDVDVLGLVLEAVVNPHWQGPAPIQQPGVTFVSDGEDEDGDEHSSEDDSETEAESASDSEQGVRNVFAPRYAHWPDFDASDDEITYNYYSSEESDDDADFEGIRYPGMNVFRLSGYTPSHINLSEPGNQQPDVSYLTDDEDDDSDDDDSEWDFESEPETEAQWWGGGFWIIYYKPFCM